MGFETGRTLNWVSVLQTIEANEVHTGFGQMEGKMEEP